MTSQPRSFFAFLRRETGSILVETVVVLPVLTILSIGVLEFGNVLWQRHQLQTGVRDAARYWSRCPNFTTDAVCEQIAENIAFFGRPDGDRSLHDLRVPGWYQAPGGANDHLTIDPATRPAEPDLDDVFRVTGAVDYQGSPVIGALGLSGAIKIQYYFEGRYLEW